jgi:hypothetical protein
MIFMCDLVINKSVSIPRLFHVTVYTYIPPHAPGYATSASGILALAGYQCGTMADLFFQHHVKQYKCQEFPTRKRLHVKDDANRVTFTQ